MQLCINIYYRVLLRIAKIFNSMQNTNKHIFLVQNERKPIREVSFTAAPSEPLRCLVLKVSSLHCILGPLRSSLDSKAMIGANKNTGQDVFYHEQQRRPYGYSSNKAFAFSAQQIWSENSNSIILR